MLFMGIDIGTQGVRGVIVDEMGKAVAGSSENFKKLNCAKHSGWYEQEPIVWWEAVDSVLKCSIEQLKKIGRSGQDIRAISIDGTSGTILPVDEEGNPLYQAMMYNDMRSESQAEKAKKAGKTLEKKLGLQYNASFALPKFLWIKENLPAIYEQTEKFIHQADFITGKLTGEFFVTDYSNALKSGYDLMDYEWPKFIEAELGIDQEKLPAVVAPGEPIKKISKDICRRYSLNPNTVVTAGATDGYASALAAGAVKPGDWASIIGTTLVLKGVTDHLLTDPSGSSYSHRLPSGAWMLGGAANIGGRYLNDCFKKDEFNERNKKVLDYIPTGVISYPLHGKGERFPFLDPNAEGFFIGDIRNLDIKYAAIMEGVAYAERLAFERMENLGAAVGNSIFTTGGACRSKEWMTIRASVLNKEMKVPKIVDAAMGCAILAAANTCFSSLEEASDQMITIGNVIEPEQKLVSQYEELYQKACEEYKVRFRM